MAAQYTIPITGMVLGNCLRSNVIGINAFGLKVGLKPCTFSAVLLVFGRQAMEHGVREILRMKWPERTWTIIEAKIVEMIRIL